MNEALLKIAEWIHQNPQETGGDIYHPLPFAEFDSLRTSSRASASAGKLRLIERTLGDQPDLTGKSVLDVGANAGFFSFSLAKRGARVDAYEPNAFYASLGERIVAATALDVSWFPRPIAASDITGKTYDIALMLSVFQWISQGNERLDHAIEILETIARAAGTLYFELGCNAGKSAIEIDGYSLPWVYRLLRRHAAPKQIYYLGSEKAWGRSRRYMFAATSTPLRLTPRQRAVTRVLALTAAGGSR